MARMTEPKPLIIVESPAKARTISRFLGSDWVVESSIGHIRDLPPSAAEIPKKYKGKKWARLGIDVENDFEPLYVIPADKKKQVTTLKKKLKQASELYLATDEDREGEAIAWHLIEVLKPDIPVMRLVFHEITGSAIGNALAEPRDIDKQLVDAQETRRILDRLVGYEVSPVLRKKLRPKLSAGRVQSVATRLIVAREEARMRFVESAFCGVEATLKGEEEQRSFTARLAELDGRKVAVGKDFDQETGELKTKALVLDSGQAKALAAELTDAPFEVTDVTEKPFTNRPYPPFMTSTLQQEAGRKLRFNARRTMRIAQSLYENGYITYMRTDSLTLSGEALGAARRQVEDLYGAEYLPDNPRVYKSKSKSAQEAHEAIRPAGGRFRTPGELKSKLDGDQMKLYELIWKRTLASQMKDAKGIRTQVRIEAPTEDQGTATFATSGKVITFAGFYRAYVASSDDPKVERDDKEKILPKLSKGQPLTVESLEPTSHTTQPPARYTEASLVKELEARGIGRPSTYASIIQTIQDRGYVWHKGQALAAATPRPHRGCTISTSAFRRMTISASRSCAWGCTHWLPPARPSSHERRRGSPSARHRKASGSRYGSVDTDPTSRSAMKVSGPRSPTTCRPTSSPSSARSRWQTGPPRATARSATTPRPASQSMSRRAVSGPTSSSATARTAAKSRGWRASGRACRPTA
jgi:DNA topoisomerase-1